MGDLHSLPKFLEVHFFWFLYDILEYRYSSICIKGLQSDQNPVISLLCSLMLWKEVGWGRIGKLEVDMSDMWIVWILKISWFNDKGGPSERMWG
jgi:hypothetical protein